MNRSKPTLRIEPDGDGMITIGEASKLLKIRSQGLRQLVHDGYIPAPQKGKISMVAAVHGYVAARKREAVEAEQTIHFLQKQDANSRRVIRKLRYGYE